MGDAISFIIVDGYNLIGTTQGALSVLREKLILRLSEYRKLKGHDITVVFDGWKSGGSREEALKTGGIAVIYSRLGENADYVIKRIIGRQKREWIVVSSDRDIAAFAWASGCIAVPSERFMSAIDRTSSNLEGEFELLDKDDYEGRDERRGKGNSRMLSKKEKALARVLRKL